MRDPNRLCNFYNELMKIHIENFPDWRFGQLVCNLERWLQNTKRLNDIFFIEEDEMMNYIKEFVEDMKPTKSICISNGICISNNGEQDWDFCK